MLYAETEHKPLAEEDWKKIDEIRWSRMSKKLKDVLALFRSGEVVSGEAMRDIAYNPRERLNNIFRRLNLPYRIFAVDMGESVYRIAVVTPLKKGKRRRSTGPNFSREEKRAIKTLVQTARALVQKPTIANLDELKRAVKNRSLPY